MKAKTPRPVFISRALLLDIAHAVEQASQKVAEAHGVSIRYKGGQYGGPSGTLKLEVSCIAEGGEVETPERVNYRLYAKSFGFPEDGLGKVVTWGRREYRVTGLRPGASRFPVAVERIPDGKVFYLPAKALNPQADSGLIREVGGR